MASSIIGASSTAPIPRERGTAEFFTLNAKYLIDPKSKTDDIGFDAQCLHESLQTVIRVIIDATEQDHHLSGLAFVTLYLCQMAASTTEAYYGMTFGNGKAPVETSAAKSNVEKMGAALNQGANSHHGIRATLEAMADEVCTRCSSEVQGLFEAAVASAERLDRSMAAGLEAWSGR